MKFSLAWCTLAVFSAAWAQSPEAHTAADCLAALDKMPRGAVDQRPATASACISQFAATATGSDLIPLALLHAEAGQREKSVAALQKRLATPDLTETERADALVATILAAQRGPRGEDLRSQWVRAAEEAAPRLDRLTDKAAWQQFIAYRWLNSAYRNDPNDSDKILKAGNRLIEIYGKLAPAQQANSEAAFGLYCAYENLAGVYASRGDNEKAKAVIREGVARIPAGPSSKALQKNLGRYELVGKPAPALEAPYWINAEPAGNRMPLGGNVTIIEFTAHWCVPCKATYPGLLRLNQKLGSRGVKIVLATSLYGYFGQERNLSPERELAADRKYFQEEHKLPFPVAIGEKSPGDKNSENYFVQAIPHLVVVDSKGVVRRFMIDLSPPEEARLAAFVEDLLREGATR